MKDFDIRDIVEDADFETGERLPPDGVACSHPGCLAHISHPCEGCGRIGGRNRIWLAVGAEVTYRSGSGKDYEAL